MSEKITLPSPPALGVSIAVFRAGRVLVATRTKPPFEGAFSLPGGHVEAGETLEAAALRELYEEVGIKARIIGFNQLVETVRFKTAQKLPRHFVIASFVGAFVDGEIRPSPEVGEVKWVAPEELHRLPVTPGLIPVVEDARRIFARQAAS